ncbi:hypothetical protein SAMN05216367_0860 [Tardiphaga sp. OK245]|nr:hypothetical protein SAMN05216367_0860 [Tardiphaga sp. OK245]
MLRLFRQPVRVISRRRPTGESFRRSNSASAPCDYGNYMLAGFASTIGWPGALVPKEGYATTDTTNRCLSSV